MMHLQRVTSGVAGDGLGAMMKYLQRKMSGAVSNGLSRFRGLLMLPFTTSALLSLFLWAHLRRQQEE